MVGEGGMLLKSPRAIAFPIWVSDCPSRAEVAGESLLLPCEPGQEAVPRTALFTEQSLSSFLKSHTREMNTVTQESDKG